MFNNIQSQIFNLIKQSRSKLEQETRKRVIDNMFSGGNTVKIPKIIPLKKPKKAGKKAHPSDGSQKLDAFFGKK